MKITLVAGTRPNFVKIAPILRELETVQQKRMNLFETRLIHTGQHYDHGMSEAFFDDLGIRKPDSNLNCGSGSQAEMTGAIMINFEKELFAHPADLVLVVGDVTSTMACSIVAKKMGCTLAHVEAGIRSGDMTMPEEINRIVTDSITDIFYSPSQSANKNLKIAGVPENRIKFVGNVMIDSLVLNLDRLRKPKVWDQACLSSGGYLVLTMHRPATVDKPKRIQALLEVICSQTKLPVVFPVHPRTRDKLNNFTKRFSSLVLTEPLGYLEFIYLVKFAKGVISDSGGVSEETTYLDVPCITLRSNTERPETVTQGTNRLVGHDQEAIREAMKDLIEGSWRLGTVPSKWDGKTSERIVCHLQQVAGKF